MSKRTSPLSEEQKKIMIEYLKENKKLLSGKFDSSFTYKVACDKWKELANILNSIPGGGNKDWKNWRKTWHDLRSRTKDKTSKIKKHMNLTGGGEPTKLVLKNIEEDIIDMVGTTSIQGHNIDERDITINLDTAQTYEVDMLDEDVEEVAKLLGKTISPRNVEGNKYAGSPTNQQKNEENQQTGSQTSKNEQKTKIIENKGKRRFATQRLEKTISATSKLATSCEQKLLIKSEYYKKRLELLEREVAAREKTAAANERIATALENV